MKMLRSKKGLLAMMLTLVLAFGSCLTVSAAEEIKPQNITYIDRPDLSKWENDYPTDYVLIWKRPGGSWHMVLSSKPFKTQFYTDRTGMRICCIYSEDFYHGYSETFENIKLNRSGSVECYIDNNQIYSSHDIYVGDELVFQKPATPLVLTAKGITPGMALQEILNLLPIVIVTMVGYLALRKGLSMLFSRLRKA